MSKLLKGSIDLTKIKKEAIFFGKKGGKYINVDIWINDEADDYGNHAGIKQSVKVNEKEFESHYIGNAKKGYGWDDNAEPKQDADVEQVDTEDDLPF